MLLATASYALPCHNSSSSSGNSNSTAQKLSRTATNQSSQKVTTTTAALMKTISVRANRNGGFSNDASVQKSQQAQQTHNKTNNSTSTLVNDSLKKTAAAAAATNSNSTNNYINSKNATKHSTTTVNVKSTTTATASTTTASTSSSSNSAAVSLKATIPSASFLKTYTVPPTALHRSSKARLRSCSIDSLHDEMCHFKPIRSLPLTPIKSGSHSRGFSLKAPKPRLCTSSKNCDFTAIKRVVDRENQRGKLKPTRKTDSKISSSIFQNMKPHLSAFVRLQPNATNDLQETATGNTSLVTVKSQKKNSKTKIQKSITTKTTAKSKKTNANNNKTEPNAQQKGKSTAETTTTTAAEKPIAAATTTKIVATKNSTNSRKRKAQTNFKLNEITETKKPKKMADKTPNANANRKTPPLTRGRKRLEGNDAQLIGPLV